MTVADQQTFATRDVMDIGIRAPVATPGFAYVGFATASSGLFAKWECAFNTVPTAAAVAQFRLEVERDSDGWIVADAPTGIYGSAPTLMGALEDFRRSTREHLDVLERQQALAPALQKQLEYLRARVRS
jgi:hypothetical protein